MISIDKDMRITLKNMVIKLILGSAPLWVIGPTFANYLETECLRALKEKYPVLENVQYSMRTGTSSDRFDSYFRMGHGDTSRDWVKCKKIKPGGLVGASWSLNGYSESNCSGYRLVMSDHKRIWDKNGIARDVDYVGGSYDKTCAPIGNPSKIAMDEFRVEAVMWAILRYSVRESIFSYELRRPLLVQLDYTPPAQF